LATTETAVGETGWVDRSSRPYSTQSLAGRFAAKEAAVKVLRPRGARPEWRSIEVHRVIGGWCELRLSGLAARLAAEAGVTTLAVSITHEPMMAAACVVAMSRGDATVWHRKSPPGQKGP
jgi:holo-[acyl-carrier protein] synthase